MENASKALLIAGAILIVILLIAVGMLVYSQSRGAIDTGVAQMSSAEITMFNAQFTNYEGVQSATATKNLLQTMLNNNTQYKDDSSKWVKVILWRCYDKNGTDTYSITGAYNCKKYSDIQDYLLKAIDDIETSKGQKNFDVRIKYSENGLVRRIDIIQEGAEDFYNKSSSKNEVI